MIDFEAELALAEIENDPAYQLSQRWLAVLDRYEREMAAIRRQYGSEGWPRPKRRLNDWFDDQKDAIFEEAFELGLLYDTARDEFFWSEGLPIVRTSSGYEVAS